MSNIDKQALREAAEKALPAMKRLLMMPNDELFDEALLNVDGDVDAANAFNLLAGPETVLALLDKLEAAESGFPPLTVERLMREKESLEERVAELEAKLAKPVQLPKTNGYWTEQERAFEEAITLAKRQVRLAGFRCEGDE